MFKRFLEVCCNVMLTVLLCLSIGGGLNIIGIRPCMGVSMKSTPLEKEHAISLIMNYEFINNNVKRFDTVIVDDVDDNLILLHKNSKRIVGLPGEHIYCDGGTVWVNGEKLIEPHAYINGIDPYIPFECTLKEGEYFVLGDNRCNSHDSRAFGAIEFSDIKAKIIYELRF